MKTRHMKTGRVRQVLLYAAPFVPLAFFKTWLASGLPLTVMTTMSWVIFAYFVALIIVSYKVDKPGYFDWAMGVCFTVAALSLSLWHEHAASFIMEYLPTGVYVSLLVAASLPPLFGLPPFTCRYAQQYTPRALWTNPVFLRINMIMTYSWSALFAVAVVVSLYPSLVTRAIIPLALFLGFGIPFTIRFPDRYLKKLGLPSLEEQRKMAAEGAKSYQETGVTMPSSVAAPADTSLIPQQSQKESTMKVLVLNSSPRTGDHSKTELMLNALSDGMRQGGADVELIHLRTKNVKNCLGCFTCWTKTPGTCVIKDDMTAELFPKWAEADLVVYGTPLYYFGINAAMKTFVERTLPALKPFFETNEGLTHHPWRIKPPKTVVLSVAGFPEYSVFDFLSQWVHFVFSDMLVAEIYRPAAEFLNVPGFRVKAMEVLAATRQAGLELVTQGNVDQDTLAIVTQPLSSNTDIALKIGNAMWKTCINEGITPMEMYEKGTIPRPDSLETFMAIMLMGFNNEEAGDTKAVIQFDFSGNVQGSCYLKIENRTIEALAGKADGPDLTVDAPFDVWIDIMTGKADGQKAFIEGRYKATGDFVLLVRMNRLFGSILPGTQGS